MNTPVLNSTAPLDDFDAPVVPATDQGESGVSFCPSGPGGTPAPATSPEEREIQYFPGTEPTAGETPTSAPSTKAGIWFSDEEELDEGRKLLGLCVLKVSAEGVRDEFIYFLPPTGALEKECFEFPKRLGEVVGADLKNKKLSDLASINDLLADVDLDTAILGQSFAMSFFHRLRVEPHVVKSWTFQGKDGNVRPINEDSIERLPAPVKAALSDTILTSVWSGMSDFHFTLPSSP